MREECELGNCHTHRQPPFSTERMEARLSGTHVGEASWNLGEQRLPGTSHWDCKCITALPRVGLSGRVFAAEENSSEGR